MAADPTWLRAVFLEEFEERHRTLQDGLLELEADPTVLDRVLPELFRAAHSLKGGAQVVQLPAMAARCHRLEETLGELRDQDRQLTAELLATLLAEVDALLEHVTELGATGPPDGQAGDAPAWDGQDLAASRRDEAAAPVAEARRPPSSAAALPTEPRPPGAVPARPASRPSLRVPVDRLDRLLDRASEVLLARDHLAQLALATRELARTAAVADRRWQDVRAHVASETAPGPTAAFLAAESAWRETLALVEALRAGTVATTRTLQEAAAGLEHSTRTVRLQPFDLACNHLPRAVADLNRSSRSERRETRLIIEADEVELDSEIVTALRDPLLHLVRNAVAHGIEDRDLRRERGKDETGTVTVSASVLGDQVEVRVADDGAGLDVAALRSRAATRGLEVDGGSATCLAWLPGVSTSTMTDEVAGRGVGLDAVRSSVEQLAGTVELSSTTGGGCTVTLRLPITLSTLHVVLVEVGGQTLALPSAAIRRIVRFEAEELQHVGGNAHVPVDDELATLVSLRAFLGLAPARASEHHVGVLVSGTDGPAVLVVDRVSASRRVTRRRLHPRLSRAPGALGTTTLPSGEVAFVINPLACIRHHLRAPAAVTTAEPEAGNPPSRVLLAEDSPTIRALEQRILESGGYDVRTAVDGAQAWDLLREHGADLVVTDVEMPGMDGFGLCEAIRSHPDFKRIPVVLVTSRASDADRHRGIEVGANAYLVKGAFDQQSFLATVVRLL